MKYYRSIRNILLPFYCIRREIHPGKVASFNDEELKNPELLSNIDYYIKAGHLEEVNETATDIVFTNARIPVVSVIIPKIGTPIQPGTVVLPKGVSQDQDIGQVVLKGKMPGQGEVKTIGQHINDQVKKASDMLQDSGKPPVETKPTKNEEKPIPPDLVEWFKLRHAQKKTQILKMTDVEKLKHISDFDDKSKKLIDQRLKELN